MGINPKTFCISSMYITSGSYPNRYTLQKPKKLPESGKIYQSAILINVDEPCLK